MNNMNNMMRANMRPMTSQGQYVQQQPQQQQMPVGSMAGGGPGLGARQQVPPNYMPQQMQRPPPMYAGPQHHQMNQTSLRMAGPDYMNMGGAGGGAAGGVRMGVSPMMPQQVMMQQGGAGGVQMMPQQPVMMQQGGAGTGGMQMMQQPMRHSGPPNQIAPGAAAAAFHQMGGQMGPGQAPSPGGGTMSLSVPSPQSMSVPTPQQQHPGQHMQQQPPHMQQQQQQQRPVPSPASVTLNTPASNLQAHSPGGCGPGSVPPSGDDAFAEKLRQMSKYIDPLREVLQREEAAGPGRAQQVRQLHTLLAILCNQRRVDIDVLIQCEKTLEKMMSQHKSSSVVDGSGGNPPGGPATSSTAAVAGVGGGGGHQSQPIICELRSHKDSHHLLHRTFSSLKDTLHGGKKARIRGPSPEPLPAPASLTLDTREAVRMEVDNVRSSLLSVRLLPPSPPAVTDPGSSTCDAAVSQTPGPRASGSVLLAIAPDTSLTACRCPTLPTLLVRVPRSYPTSGNPVFLDQGSLDKLSGTPTLSRIRRLLDTKLLYLPDKYSVMHLVHMLEMTIKSVTFEKPPDQ